VQAQVMLPDMRAFTGDIASTRQQVGAPIRGILFLSPSSEIWAYGSSHPDLQSMYILSFWQVLSSQITFDQFIRSPN
jgi:hypothetical protein